MHQFLKFTHFLSGTLSEAQMEDFSLRSFITLLSGASGFTVLGIITWAWFTRRIITRGEKEEADARTEDMRQERDEWKALALRSINVTESSQATTVQAAKATVQAAKAVETVVASTPTPAQKRNHS